MTACGGGSPTDNTTGGSLRPTAVASSVPTAKPTPRYKPADAKGRARNVQPPLRPALSSENSKEGAESFIRYWFWLFNYGVETGDLSKWTKRASPACEFCSSLKKGVAASYRDGGWLVGGGVSLPIVRVTYKPGAAKQPIIVQVAQEVTHYYLADKSVARSPTPENSSTVGIYVSYANGAWSVVDMHPLR
ncbi:DUF6318 family protein [Arthrobacter sp. NPDC056493]|uniref:DUF6318 family protein n=1 Tax=Arthrobacter sp. NPDC056493 TaxID=3345839 RepID=UPI00366E4FA1